MLIVDSCPWDWGLQICQKLVSNWQTVSVLQITSSHITWMSASFKLTSVLKQLLVSLEHL